MKKPKLVSDQVQGQPFAIAQGDVWGVVSYGVRSKIRDKVQYRIQDRIEDDFQDGVHSTLRELLNEEA
jgi:hypothetical protein